MKEMSSTTLAWIEWLDRTLAQCSAHGVERREQSVVALCRWHRWIAVFERDRRRRSGKMMGDDVTHGIACARFLLVRDEAEIAARDGAAGDDVVLARCSAGNPRRVVRDVCATDYDGGIEGKIFLSRQLFPKLVQDACGFVDRTVTGARCENSG